MTEISFEMEKEMKEKLTLYGFNNLTKSLSFNIYDICYAKTQREQKDYIAYIDEQYNSDRLVNILCRLAEMIGAKVLSISKQDYEPQGASATLLIAEESMLKARGSGDPESEIISHNDETLDSENSEAAHGDGVEAHSDTTVAHLDKSHVTVHTYPEFHPDTSIATFRVDIDVATCGEITPLQTLDYLIGSFDSDIIIIDYKVRGFTRNVRGEKLFLDHRIASIQDYIDKNTLVKYDAMDLNMYQANLFHTRMMINDLDIQNYLFKTDAYEMPPKTRLEITQNLRQEMIEIYSGRNIFGKEETKG